jgi:hypothetical protein
MSVYRRLAKSIFAGHMSSKCIRRLLYLFLFCHSALFATNIPGTITLFNDSPFILTASVYTNTGSFLGTVTLQPGQQSNFVTNVYSTPVNRPGTPTTSITPYRVIWQCAGGGFYSMCTDASVGAFVRATACPGQLYCTPKEDQKKQKEVGPPGAGPPRSAPPPPAEPPPGVPVSKQKGTP